MRIFFLFVCFCFMLLNNRPVVLMIIQAGEKNVADQRSIEYALWE